MILFYLYITQVVKSVKNKFCKVPITNFESEKTTNLIGTDIFDDVDRMRKDIKRNLLTYLNCMH